MLIALLSFVGGFLSVLAPCVLPLLPIIIGGGLKDNANKLRPYIITASLALSLIAFTIALKISTAFIGISPRVWDYISGGLIVLLGLTMLFPHYWELVIGKLGLQSKSQEALGKSHKATGIWQPILTGVALGPVFSSCSPMYAWVVATVLPESTTKAGIYLALYCLGLSSALLLIALLGRKATDKFKILSNPQGAFQKTLGIIFLIMGLAIITAFHKDVQTFLVEKDLLKFKVLEQALVPKD